MVASLVYTGSRIWLTEQTVAFQKGWGEITGGKELFARRKLGWQGIVSVILPDLLELLAEKVFVCLKHMGVFKAGTTRLQTEVVQSMCSVTQVQPFLFELHEPTGLEF